MDPALPRRDALRLGTAASLPLLAGCTGGGDDGSDHPDAGTDSYGVRVDNRSELTYTVDLRVVEPSSGERRWEKTVDVEGESTREWTSVITGDTEQVLVAELPKRTPRVDVSPGKYRAIFWITPGSEDAPDVETLDVILEYRSDDDYSKKKYWISITHEETDVTG